MAKHCVDILCCFRVQHPQHNNTIKNLYLHQVCLLITFLQLKIAALQSKLKFFIYCKDSGVACMYKNIQISSLVLLDKIHKIWKNTGEPFCKCYTILFVLQGVQLLNYMDLILERAFPLTSKLKPVLLAVVCDTHVHHCECATCSGTNLVTSFLATTGPCQHYLYYVRLHLHLLIATIKAF